jgi:hypothetical protein
VIFAKWKTFRQSTWKIILWKPISGETTTIFLQHLRQLATDVSAWRKLITEARSKLTDAAPHGHGLRGPQDSRGFVVPWWWLDIFLYAISGCHTRIIPWGWLPLRKQLRKMRSVASLCAKKKWGANYSAPCLFVVWHPSHYPLRIAGRRTYKNWKYCRWILPFHFWPTVLHDFCADWSLTQPSWLKFGVMSADWSVHVLICFQKRNRSLHTLCWALLKKGKLQK